MIGVILWSNRETGNAVIWCEDHGDLAFVEHHETPQDGACPYDVGDMVGFDLHETENLRSAENIYRLQDVSAPQLISSLQCHETAKKPAPAANQDNVVAFPTEQRRGA